MPEHRSPSTEELPRALRDALVGLLLADLAARDGGSGRVDAALALLAGVADDAAVDFDGEVAARAAAPAAASSDEPLFELLGALATAAGARGAALRDARAATDVHQVARRRLAAYRGALAVAPRGDDLAQRLAQAVVLLEHGLFFEVHEVLEPPWRTATGDERLLLQGVIQAAVAWHHGAAGRAAPAARASAAALAKLERGPGAWHGFPLAALADAVRRYRAGLTSGRVAAERLALR